MCQALWCWDDSSKQNKQKSLLWWSKYSSISGKRDRQITHAGGQMVINAMGKETAGVAWLSWSHGEPYSLE